MKETQNGEEAGEGTYHLLASTNMSEKPFPVRLISTIDVQLSAMDGAGTRRGHVLLRLSEGEAPMHDPYVVVETATLGNGQLGFFTSRLTSMDDLRGSRPGTTEATIYLQQLKCLWSDTGESVILWVGGWPWGHVIWLLYHAEKLIKQEHMNQPIGIRLYLVVDPKTSSGFRIEVTNLLNRLSIP